MGQGAEQKRIVHSFGGDHFPVRWIVPLRRRVASETLDGPVDGGIRMLAERSESRDFAAVQLDGHGTYHAVAVSPGLRATQHEGGIPDSIGVQNL
jgi:hypothetical protein